jgi:hypothetical protein
MHLNFPVTLVASLALRTAWTMALVALGALGAGCRTVRAPDSSRGPGGDGRATAAIPLGERCALVGTIITGAEARIFDGAIAVRASLASRNGAARPFFGAQERCSDRMIVGQPRAVSPDGGLVVSIDLSEAAPEGYAFEATGAVTLAGRIAKDPDGTWRIAAASTRRKPRPLDKAPVARELSSAMSAGHAEARFEIDTGGGDIMGAPAREAGLAVVFCHDRRELRQVIASCPEAVRGNVLGDAVAPVLDIAGCNGFFRLVRRVGEVVVEREGDEGGSPVVVTSIPIPPGIGEVHGPVR